METNKLREKLSEELTPTIDSFSWLALVKMEENAKFFPEKLPSFFCLQHPEFSTKLAQN
jgi:hypothetical protein